VRPEDDSPIEPALVDAELARTLDPALRDDGLAQAPPAGFADRVLATAQPVVRHERASRRPALWLSAAVAVAAAFAFAVWAATPKVQSGGWRAERRESIVLGERGVAVAEAGADLHWLLHRGGPVEVEQRAGDVFYRVERGGPFRVQTPAGTVEVHGTCFRVEVSEMKIGKQGVVGASVGAALAATVVVSVYEGKVSYANEQGRVELVAGEQAQAMSGRAPSTPSAVRAAVPQDAPAATTLTREALIERAEAQAKEIAALRAKVQGLEGSGEGGSAGGGHGEDKRNFLNPTKEELLELAKDCKLRWDSPKIGAQPTTIGADRAQELGLSEEERQATNKVNADFNTKLVAELRALYVELTGDKAGADALSPGSLVEELEEKSPEGELQLVFQKLARERAGLQAPPSDLRGASPAERMMRLRIGAGDRYEHELGAAIGPDLAHQMREKHGGWGSRSSSSYGCPR
jgi:hypothetical protein